LTIGRGRFSFRTVSSPSTATGRSDMSGLRLAGLVKVSVTGPKCSSQRDTGV